jgi:hypothetical protein
MASAASRCYSCSELRTISHDANEHSILFRDNFTARKACRTAGLAAVHAAVRPMIGAAIVSIAMCAGAHMVMVSHPKKTQERVRTRIDVLRDMHRVNARRATLACATAGPQVPIQMTTIRKEDAL